MHKNLMNTQAFVMSGDCVFFNTFVDKNRKKKNGEENKD